MEHWRKVSCFAISNTESLEAYVRRRTYGVYPSRALSCLTNAVKKRSKCLKIRHSYDTLFNVFSATYPLTWTKDAAKLSLSKTERSLDGPVIEVGSFL